MKRLIAPLASILLLAAGATPAMAAPPPRYASPSGTSADDCATPATACDIATAIDGSGGNAPVGGGQEIIVEPGTYTLTATLAPTVNGIYVHGALGEPRPVIKGTGIELLSAGSPSDEFSYLEFDSNGTSGLDALSVYGALLDRLLVQGDPGGNLCQCYGGVLRDSVLVISGSGGGGAWGLNSNGGSSTETLRNDTLIATSASVYAIAATQNGHPSSPTTIDAKNVIAINTAGGHDVWSFGPQMTVDIANSDYSNPLTGSGGVIASGGGNIAAAPQFVDGANGDYRELPTSPTVDAGTNDTANDGSLDFAGGPRLSGSHTDIGAFEYQPPAAVTITGGQGQSATVKQSFASPLSVEVVDAQGDPVPDASVTFTAPGSGASAAFGSAASVHVTAGADGIASVPAPTAGSIAGAYTVTAAATGTAAQASFALRNLPGSIASLKLTPQSGSVPAGTSVSYAVEGFDGFGNDAGAAGSGIRLSIAPDGACTGLSCTAQAPGPHTVTATLGSISATATLDVTALAPRLAFVRHTVRISSHTRRGRLSGRCTAPAGELCTVTGKLTVSVHGRALVYGTIGGRLHAGVMGHLQVTLTRAGIGWLRTHSGRAKAKLTVKDLSGTASVSVALGLSTTSAR
jgi:hypothetical protein